MNDRADRAVAIVGLGAILPDAPNAPAFRDNVWKKRYSIIEVPPGRWKVEDYYDPDPSAPDKTYSKIGSWVRGFEFDWKRWHIPPKVAKAMDEGQQWAVTIAAEALADYGWPERKLDTERTAVILGNAMAGEQHYMTTLRIQFPECARWLNEAREFLDLPADVRQRILSGWHERMDATLPPVTEDTMPGELANILSGRVANVLNLRGPNFTTDAACASSFAALDAAVDALVEHHCDTALTGGIDRNMGVNSFVKFCKIGALSATGTRPFGDGADGFVMGEGSAAFLLKRLADAERDGDRIYAVVRGVGGSSDGKGKSITAPNPIGQELAVERAWKNAGIDPLSAGLIEAHGTSTKVGDLVEVESLAKVFGGAPRGAIALGSAKSNIGHLKAGAGAAGLLKAVYAVHEKVLPPTLHAEKPNPGIDFASSPFSVNHELREWTATNGAPRCCGVSAYGFGGTNFHIVLEEHVPGALTKKDRPTQVAVPAPGGTGGGGASSGAGSGERARTPLRGVAMIGAPSLDGLRKQVDALLERAKDGQMPPVAAPDPADLRAPERIAIDFGDQKELVERLKKTQKGLSADAPATWRALQAQGIFRGSGPAPGQIAFLFTGQGSQYVNMGRDLAEREPVVADVFKEADAVLEPVLGRTLTSYVYVDGKDHDAVKQAEEDLKQTAITQPAVLSMDIAMTRLLGEYGIEPDMVMGHSLGEYGALVSAGVLTFAEALEAAAARGREMSRVSLGDNGAMAAVMAPIELVEEVLGSIDGYVVPANLNARGQSVIGGATDAVERAVEAFQKRGYQAQRLPVSHAFHTKIVAPAAEPLRKVLERFDVQPPKRRLVGNVEADFYPPDPEAIRDLLCRQIASPVRWVEGLERLYQAGARAFVEVGPKRALKGFVDDVLTDKPDVTSLFTNRPRPKELAAFNQALCGLYAAGYGARDNPDSSVSIARSDPEDSPSDTPVARRESAAARETRAPEVSESTSLDEIKDLLSQALRSSAPVARGPYDRNETPQGSIVISGTGLGLPGVNKPLMDERNAERILAGEQFIELVPESQRRLMAHKRVTRLVKTADGSGHFELIDDTKDVIKLAGRAGAFDLAAEYGVPAKLIEALDTTTQLAMAAGIDALREAGIPLVQTYRKTTTGKYLPEKWMLPEPLRDETGVIFASAFPGFDRFADENRRYYTYESRVTQRQTLEELRQVTTDPAALREIQRRIADLDELIAREPYVFDRRFLFRILPMGHAQIAEYIGARGPNTHVNAACASTAQGVALAEDWIRSGRCRRVLVVGADNASSDNLLEWIGSGFLATGAVATDDKVEEAALPFDRRRHGTLMGMGACALLVESQDAVQERGMRGIVELLSSEAANSAFHATRLDVEHICGIVESLVAAAERRFGISRMAMAPETVFISHETYTPARGGSAAAEVMALRHVFGPAANQIIVSNTKGFTGHPMGVGIEDVIGVKILEHGIVPPVPNFKEPDAELGSLTLSRGGRYPVQYAIHLAAGFGSQIALTLTRRIPGGPDRVDDRLRRSRWLADVSGYDRAETEIVQRTLRVVAQGVPGRAPVPSPWRFGLGPTVRTPMAAGATPLAHAPAATAAPAATRSTAPAPLSPALTAPGAPSSAIAPGATAAPATFPPPGVSTSSITPGATLSPAPPTPVPAPAPPAQVSAPGATPAPTTAAPSTPAAAPAANAVVAKVLAIVSEKTGYPPDMLDLELDLEADLGVDTVKQAETFAAVREAYGIERQENLKLRDFPTLQHVVEFVYEFAPGARPGAIAPGATVAPAPPSATAPAASPPAPPASASPAPAESPGPSGPPTPTAAPLAAPSAPSPEDPVVQKVLRIVSDKTGYPPDMLEMDLDLEADLGVDTVKQAETFAAVREAYGIERQESLKLRDFPTLKHVVEFVYQFRPDLAAGVHSAPEAPSQADASGATVAPAAPSPAPASVSPAFTAPEAPSQARASGAMSPPAAPAPTTPGLPPAAPSSPGPTPAVTAATSLAPTPTPVTARLEAADTIPRRVPVPSLRPAFDLCKPTGVSLAKGTRVVVVGDDGGVGKALGSALGRKGVKALKVGGAVPSDDLRAQLATWLEEGPVQGVFWLPALDIEPPLAEMDLAAFREANRRRVKNLHAAMQLLYESVSTPGTFLVSATRMGGLHGQTDEGTTAPLGGAVAGFTKSYKREQPEALVKVVDFAPDAAEEQVVQALLAETLADPGIVEVGHRDGLRWTITLEEQAAADGRPGLALGQDTLFVVTGAAGGITSAIVADLAAASGGTFVLLDLVAEPPRDDPKIALLRRNREELKRALIEEARAKGDKPTPVTIDKEIMAVERSEAALRAIEAVEAAGGKALWRSANLLDGPALTAIVEEVKASFGRIDVLVHAGGIEISRKLPEKEPREFDLVFDIKADGFFSLLKAAEGMPIGATVVFSSIAGRFGNAGQADYSAANALLCSMSRALRRARPETRAVAIDWTAWGGIGMATRGSIPAIMAAAGISMLPPEAGVPTVRRELVAGGRSGELVVAGTLGIMGEELDETGGLDTAKAQAALAARKKPLIMVGEVKGAHLYGGFEMQTTLDPTEQPFLFDHQIDGTPVLPGVMGTEAFAAVASLVCPGFQLAGIEEESFLLPFKFFRNKPATLHLSAVASPVDDGEILVRTTLRSIVQPKPELPAQVRVHFQGRVRMGRRAPARPTVRFRKPTLKSLDIGKDAVYEVYFHGPAYQVVERAAVDEDSVVALLARDLPPATEPKGADTLTVPRLLELLFQAAGLWLLVRKKTMALPTALDQAVFLRRGETPKEGRLYAVVEVQDDGRAFDARVVDEKGRVYVELLGYRTVALPEARTIRT